MTWMPVPLVSVIVPTHNRPDLLSEALASIRAQTFTDYEIIVVSNGETRQNRSYSENTARDAKAQWFSLKSGNVCAARNFGIARAKGEWIALLDDDDLWLPNALERLVAEAFRAGADMVAADYVEFWSDGHEVVYRPRPPEGWSFTKAASHIVWWALPGTTLVRKTVYQELGGFDPRQRYTEDGDMWRRISWRHKIHQMDEIIFRYRRGHSQRMEHERLRCLYELRMFVRMRLDTPSYLRSELPSFGTLALRRIGIILFPRALRERLELEPWSNAQWHRLWPLFKVQAPWIQLKRTLRPRTRWLRFRRWLYGPHPRLRPRTRLAHVRGGLLGIIGIPGHILNHTMDYISDKYLSGHEKTSMMEHLPSNPSNTFCVYPWTHFYTWPGGTAALCCLAQDVIRKEDGSPFNVRRDNLHDIWNSPHYKRIRSSMLRGEEIKSCETCYKNERNRIESLREIANKGIQHFNPKDGWFYNRLTDSKDLLTAKNPISFDIRLGNICNLKCRMCGPMSSSQLERDPIVRAWAGWRPDEPIGENISDWPEGRNLLERLKSFSAEAVQLNILGGEPTVNEVHINLLQYFVDNEMAGQITLYGISNYTNARERAFKLFSAFKNPRMDVSLDGIGSTFEYIRFPAKWNSVVKNIKTVRTKYPNITICAHPTFQAYNALDICDLFDWCEENGIPFCSGNLLHTPSYLRAVVLPEAARELAAQRLERWTRTRPTSPHVDNIQGLIEHLRDSRVQPGAEDVDKFVRYTNDLDESRKQDIRHSLPELCEIWNSYYPWDRTAFAHCARSAGRG